MSPTRLTVELHTAILRAPDPPARPAERAAAPLGHLHAAMPIKYADSSGVRIAYQVIGGGPVDLVFSPSFVTNLGATWDDPTYRVSAPAGVDEPPHSVRQARHGSVRPGAGLPYAA